MTIRLVKIDKEKANPDGQLLLASNILYKNMIDETQLTIMPKFGTLKNDLTFFLYTQPTMQRMLKFIEDKTPVKYSLPEILSFKDNDNSVSKLSRDEDTTSLIAGWHTVFRAHYVSYLRTGQTATLDKRVYYFLYAKVAAGAKPEDPQVKTTFMTEC